MPDSLVHQRAPRPKATRPKSKPASFSLLALPAELGCKILRCAITTKKSYRSLLLVCRQVTRCIPIDTLQQVAITLLTCQQIEAFKIYLQEHPEAIPHVHMLWIVCTTADRSSRIQILTLCTNIRALGCYSGDLMHIVNDRVELRHHNCLDLTLFQDRYRWLYEEYEAPWLVFFSRLRRLHLVGSLKEDVWSPFFYIPPLDNLQRFSLALGSLKHINTEMLQELVTSPRLHQIVITTRQTGRAQLELSKQVEEIGDPRFRLLFCLCRWKESDAWVQGVADPDSLWNLAAPKVELQC